MRELSAIEERLQERVSRFAVFEEGWIIHQDAAKKIYVPWDKIKAEIPLAA